MNRRLALKTEHLTELTSSDLAAVAGGAQELTLRDCPRPTIDRCLTGMYPSINMPCDTLLTTIQTG